VDESGNHRFSITGSAYMAGPRRIGRHRVLANHSRMVPTASQIPRASGVHGEDPLRDDVCADAATLLSRRSVLLLL
jgi:hypothetical protein